MKSTGLLLTIAVLSFSASAHAVTIDWVTVGDPGNVAEPPANGYGAVADAFRIMKFEFTNSQYTDFLNAVDPNGNNPNLVYNGNIGSDARGGISFTAGNAAGSKYAAKTNMGDKPVNYVSWWDAARVANWLQNGQGSGSTETGAYTLNNATNGTAPAVNPGAQYFIPTENQWYKAAYYKGGGTNAGYWKYATQSDRDPTVVNATTVGTGTSGGVSPVTTGNFANYNIGAAWNGQNGNVTTVGTNGGPSAYGAFDMSGNVFEWNDLTGAAGSSRGLRGGYWAFGPFGLSSSARTTFVPAIEGSDIGFRLASQVDVPSTIMIFVASDTQTQEQAGFSTLSGIMPIIKTGLGTVIFDASNTFSSSLNVNEGTVVAANVQAIGTATLEVAAGATFAVSPLIGAANPVQLTALGDISGTIELDTGRFSLPAADESPEAQLRDLLISGRNGGGWNGTAGIVSSEAAGSAGTRAIGYAVANDGSAVVSFAAPGDTNLNGQVDVFDLVSVNSSGKYGSGQSAVWSQGDFNYDGVTNVFDLVGINTAGAYGQGNYLPSTLAVTVVPEPSTYAMALAGLACGGYLVRRRRKRA